MTVSSIRYLRAWEVNRDGTIAGLAATAIDLDEHAPTRMKVLPAALDRTRTCDELVLYGELIHRNLFTSVHAYALEIWGNMKQTGPGLDVANATVVQGQWAYVVFPLARPNHADPDVDPEQFDYAYAHYTDNQGVTHDAVRFNLLEGNAWGIGPHPVRFVDIDGALHPAYLDMPIEPSCIWRGQTTTMAPITALQYTDHVRTRKVADAWPT